MSPDALTEFGKLLIANARDRSIVNWDKMVDGRMKGATAELVRAELRASGPESAAALQKLLPLVVDTVLHNLLEGIEQSEALQILLRDQSGESQPLADLSDGLSGELYGARGWIARYSKERHGEK